LYEPCLPKQSSAALTRIQHPASSEIIRQFERAPIPRRGVVSVTLPLGALALRNSDILFDIQLGCTPKVSPLLYDDARSKTSYRQYVYGTTHRL